MSDLHDTRWAEHKMIDGVVCDWQWSGLQYRYKTSHFECRASTSSFGSDGSSCRTWSEWARIEGPLPNRTDWYVVKPALDVCTLCGDKWTNHLYKCTKPVIVQPEPQDPEYEVCEILMKCGRSPCSMGYYRHGMRATKAWRDLDHFQRDPERAGYGYKLPDGKTEWISVDTIWWEAEHKVWFLSEGAGAREELHPAWVRFLRAK